MDQNPVRRMNHGHYRRYGFSFSQLVPSHRARWLSFQPVRPASPAPTTTYLNFILRFLLIYSLLVSNTATFEYPSHPLHIRIHRYTDIILVLGMRIVAFTTDAAPYYEAMLFPSTTPSSSGESVPSNILHHDIPVISIISCNSQA